MVRTFAKTFLQSHPKAGKPTGFKRKIRNKTKIHTVRAKYSVKKGDILTPREWTGLQYRSPQATISDDLMVYPQYLHCVNGEFYIDDLERELDPDNFDLNELLLSFLDGSFRKVDAGILAKNDGLSTTDFLFWFKKEFHGQIVHWTDYIY